MIHLYMPDEYDDACSAEVRYPVIYMFDGHNLFYDGDATYGKSWGLKDFLDHWHKKVIVVGMECSHTGHDRIKEYCPYRINKNTASAPGSTISKAVAIAKLIGKYRYRHGCNSCGCNIYKI